MNPTSKPVTVTLRDRQVVLHFNFNTYSAFEEKTGKFWMDWWADVIRRGQRAVLTSKAFEQLQNKELPAEDVERILRDNELTGMEAMKVITIREMTAIIWAAAHELRGPDKQVHYLFSFGEVGEMLGFDNFTELLVPIMQGVRENMPGAKATKAEEKQDEPERPIKRTQRNKPSAGGAISGPSDEEILASAIQR